VAQIIRQRGTGPGRHHVGTPGDIISECLGDFIGIRIGESVGHYENGELVVDTTSFLDKHEFDFVDNWRTPHTKDMHVVEWFRLIDGGKGLEATVTVDDAGTFNQPWSGTVRWQRVNRVQLLESICAENNEAFEKYFVNLREYPMPQAKTTDF
jgi:hypothetical protein